MSDDESDIDGDVTYLDGYWVYILYICTLYIVYLSKDGYDKAYRDAYRDYTSNETAADETAESDQESSDENSDQESSDQESDQESSDQSEDKDHKYTYKYKYKYAYKPDKPSDKYKSRDKPNDDPKDKPKDDKQTDQKYSVNCISTGLPGLYFNTDDSSEDERQIVNYDPESKQRYIYHWQCDNVLCHFPISPRTFNLVSV